MQVNVGGTISLLDGEGDLIEQSTPAFSLPPTSAGFHGTVGDIANGEPMADPESDKNTTPGGVAPVVDRRRGGLGRQRRSASLATPNASGTGDMVTALCGMLDKLPESVQNHNDGTYDARSRTEESHGIHTVWSRKRIAVALSPFIRREKTGGALLLFLSKLLRPGLELRLSRFACRQIPLGMG